MDMSSFYKAVAGGVATAIVGELSRYGFHPGPESITALGVLLTGVVSYLVGHALVYFAPKNK